jgi:hypothetical protein
MPFKKMRKTIKPVAPAHPEEGSFLTKSLISKSYNKPVS